MLKLVLVLTLFGFSIAAATPLTEYNEYDHTLADSVGEILEPIDFNKVLPIILDAVSWDEEVREVIEFMSGPEFRNIVVTVQGMKQFQDTLKTLYKLGLDVYFYLNVLHDLLGLPIIPYPEDVKYTKTLIGFFEKLVDALPIEEMGKIYYDKLENDPVLIKAMATIGSDEFVEIGDVVQAMPEFRIIMDSLNAKGIDAEAVLQAIKDFFGWNRP